MYWRNMYFQLPDFCLLSLLGFFGLGCYRDSMEVLAYLKSE